MFIERKMSDQLNVTKIPQKRSIPPSLLVSAIYDGEAKVAVLKFYDPNTQTIHLWYDNTRHKPYCYSRLPIEDLKNLKNRPDVLDLKVEKKKDLLRDTEVNLTKIIVDNPLVIGGTSSNKSIRNMIDAWEADIKYYESYLYDKGLIVGAFYEEKDSKIVPVSYEVPKVAKESLKKVLDKSDPDFKSHILEWIKLLSQPLPSIRRASLDIEVLPPAERRIPNPIKAEFPVLAVSIVGSDGASEVYLLRRENLELGKNKLEDKVKVFFFENEKDLISSVFKRILDYPFLITFNGDDFDLNYLYHRAMNKFGFSKDQIPISLGRNAAYLKYGVHIDLYKIFRNKSLQIYAFGNKYIEHTLNGVSKALINESKMEFEGSLGSLPLYELAKYCYKDSLMTYNLTSFNDDLLMKLLIVLGRVAKMPIDDVARIGVSNWIRSVMYFEHRRINALIPKKEEMEEKGGAVSKPITKGKKYKGALVVEPKAGVHFNVLVLDFASLYPSIIKVYNLSYDTVHCIHPECKKNLIPKTDQWVCKNRKGISSLVIGSLRDLRVNYYKPLSKDTSLSSDDISLYSVVTQALKVILNASYGVMGSEIYPLYCLPVAEATTAIGRYLISKTIEKCKELGISVVYGDTDSLFLESPTKEQIKIILKWAEDGLKIELDLEKTYLYVAFSQRKKNYLGVLLDGSVDIKGLTGKKRHIPPFIKNAFYNTVDTLSKVKSPNDFGKAREAIKKQLREKYLQLKSKKIPLEEMAFNVMMSKDISRYTETQPQHVKVAKLMKKNGQEVKAGEIISFVKTKTPLGVKPLNLAKIDDIDTEKYLDYLRGTFEQLLDALGYSFDEILGTMKLEDFFWCV